MQHDSKHSIVNKQYNNTNTWKAQHNKMQHDSKHSLDHNNTTNLTLRKHNKTWQQALTCSQQSNNPNTWKAQSKHNTTWQTVLTCLIARPCGRGRRWALNAGPRWWRVTNACAGRRPPRQQTAADRDESWRPSQTPCGWQSRRHGPTAPRPRPSSRQSPSQSAGPDAAHTTSRRTVKQCLT